jgi:glycosyltransferase involved in cell wall biosynthesis
MLHVAQISFYLDRERRDPERLLIEWPSLVDIAEAAHSADMRVSVVQAAARSTYVNRRGVQYYFLAPQNGAASIASGDGLSTMLEQLRPDVIHVHGLGFPKEVLALRRIAPHLPVLLQDHAGNVPRIWRRLVWRRALSTVAAVAFCARAQARPFVNARLLPATMPIHEIPESTSRFTPGDKAGARRNTGVHGNPCVLWVGHLNDNKDPLTVLDGIARAVRALPELQMWCCFGTAPRREEVAARIDSDPALRGRVHLIGRVPHGQVEQLMRAADLFVLGSHREGSGYAVIEALACGLPPVITDIPSFRALTGGAKVGRLWRCGDPADLSEALLSIAPTLSDARVAVREHFDAQLSSRALGRRLRAAYVDMLRTRRELQSNLS